MAKVRVPLYGVGQQRVATVDTEATPGAIVGVNLFNPDGTLWQPSAAGAGTPSSGGGIALDDVQVLADDPITVDGSLAQGAVTLGLSDLADSGAGTFKLLTRDGKGRVTGTKPGKTTDVPEGTNLYFTAARAFAAMLAQLVAGAHVKLTADTQAQTLTVDAVGVPDALETDRGDWLLTNTHDMVLT